MVGGWEREWWLLDYNLMSCLSNPDNLFIYFRHTPPPATMASLLPFFSLLFHSAHSFAAAHWNLLQAGLRWNNPIAGSQIYQSGQFRFFMACNLIHCAKIKDKASYMLSILANFAIFRLWLLSLQNPYKSSISHWGEFKCIHSKTLPVVF